MAYFKHEGFSYDVYIRPWRKGKARYEVIRWKTGFRNFWERIPYDEFVRIKAASELRNLKKV